MHGFKQNKGFHESCDVYHVAKHVRDDIFFLIIPGLLDLLDHYIVICGDINVPYLILDALFFVHC